MKVCEDIFDKLSSVELCQTPKYLYCRQRRSAVYSRDAVVQFDKSHTRAASSCRHAMRISSPPPSPCAIDLSTPLQTGPYPLSVPARSDVRSFAAPAVVNLRHEGSCWMLKLPCLLPIYQQCSTVKVAISYKDT